MSVRMLMVLCRGKTNMSTMIVRYKAFNSCTLKSARALISAILDAIVWCCLHWLVPCLISTISNAGNFWQLERIHKYSQIFTESWLRFVYFTQPCSEFDPEYKMFTVGSHNRCLSVFWAGYLPRGRVTFRHCCMQLALRSSTISLSPGWLLNAALAYKDTSRQQ